MGFFRNEKESLISDVFRLAEKHGNMEPNWAYEVALYEDHLRIKQRVGGAAEATLKYSQITDVFHGRKTEIVERQGSIIGRAIVGGLLFGGAGAVVGAMTASGKKKEKGLYFIISYKSSAGEDQYLLFEDTRRYKGKRLAEKLGALCNIGAKGEGENAPVEL